MRNAFRHISRDVGCRPGPVQTRILQIREIPMHAPSAPPGRPAAGPAADALPQPDLLPALQRIAAALERLAPPPRGTADLAAADAFVWQADSSMLEPVQQVARVPLPLLKGIEQQRRLLLGNTRRFADGLPANNALLWGARGMGKSSLVKAIHAEVNEGREHRVVLIEIHREDIGHLPHLLRDLRDSGRNCLLFCDDLSFDHDDTSYKSLKAVLEGGIEGRPANVLFYATSNRRHLMPRDMVENEQSTAINPAEAVEEKVSLSDRFGLWLGFHTCSQQDYLEMLRGYADACGLEVADEVLRREGLEWATTRGARSGRVAWQFIQDLAGRLGRPLSFQDRR